MKNNNSAVKDKETEKASVPVAKQEPQRKQLPQLQRELNHLLEEFARGMDLWHPRFVDSMFGDFHVNVDFKDNGNELVLNAEIPGVSLDDLELTLGANTMTIKGEKKTEKEENEKGFYRSERTYGCFQRVLPLPCPIDKDNVEATYKNGVLKVVLAKCKEAMKDVQKINIKADNS